MARQVSKNMVALTAMEKSVKPEAKELEPLKPMIDTLAAYCTNLEIKLDPEEIITKLGGQTSKYY